MKYRGPTVLERVLQYLGALFLLTLLGLAVLSITTPEPGTDEHCASSSSHTC